MPVKQWFFIYMPEICPKIVQDISKIYLRYAQVLPKIWGFILRKWDKMSPGRVHQLGQYVSGEVHNAVGQFVLGTKCLLTKNIDQQFHRKLSAKMFCPLIMNETKDSGKWC